MVDEPIFNKQRKTSNYGKHWVSYKEAAQEKFSEWKYENFIIWDEDGNNFIDNGVDMETLDIGLDDLFHDFLRTTSVDLYYKRIVKNMISQSRCVL